jgi:CubicO group peptidase (beta-lactamase class C family)
LSLHGTLHPDFHGVARVLESQLRGSRGGAAVCVYHRGECVVDLFGGARDPSGRPWERDTAAPSFSTTKGVMATLLHVLVDRGLVDYDDPVAKHWPEFGQGGKQRITVRQLLSHGAGLHDIRPRIDHARRMLDWEYMTDVLARGEPSLPPGSRSAYHALTYGWLVGELVQRVSGQPLGRLLDDLIATPLALDGLYVGVPAAHLGRVARLIPGRLPPQPGRHVRRVGGWIETAFGVLSLPLNPRHFVDALAPHGIREFDFSADETVRVPIPAANGHFTARSLARLYAALADGGELDGVRILSRDTLQRATRIEGRGFDRVVPFPMHWRLGFHRAATTRGTLPGGFGHFGFGGSGAFCDPASRLAVALVLNSGVGTPFGDLRILQVGGAAVAAARRREQRDAHA